MEKATLSRRRADTQAEGGGHAGEGQEEALDATLTLRRPWRRPP